jgi:hypothetical protein
MSKPASDETDFTLNDKHSVVTTRKARQDTCGNRFLEK